MTSEILYFDALMLVLDSITISGLRRFLLDFITGKNNVNKIKKVHCEQPWKERVTLSYIRARLKHYQKEFHCWHTLYMLVLTTLIPQYIILIVCNLLIGFESIWVACILWSWKLVICIVLRFQVNSLMISKYSRRY